MFAAIQYKPPKGNPEQARNEISTLITEACKNGAQLIVLPEMATTGYVWPDKESILPFAEPSNGPTFQALSLLAKEYSAWIICGYVEKEEENLYNAALVINEKGQKVCSYRKILLYEADYTWATPGHTRYLIHTPFGRMTPSICMDLNDYLFVQFLWKEKPDVIAFCTNWLDEGGTVLEYWLQRLRLWKGWFLAANSWGPDADIVFCGQSTILTPQKKPVDTAQRTGNHIVYAPI